MARIIPLPIFQHQADAYLSQANPVSAQLYTVLDTTKNARIISLAALVTWATTQPTNMDIVVTIDGQSLVFRAASPVSGTGYHAFLDGYVAGGGYLDTPNLSNRSFILEGRSVKVEVRITWATTQPTPLVCRVKYAKIP